MAFKDSFKRMLTKSHGGTGSWVLVRHFSNVHSKYWNEDTKEAVGGPAFEYVDSATVAAKQIAFETGRPNARIGEVVLPNQEVLLETYRYFLLPTVTIEEDDEIFDLNHSGNTPPAQIDYEGKGVGVSMGGRFRVRFVHEYSASNNGEISYRMALVERIYV